MRFIEMSLAFFFLVCGEIHDYILYHNKLEYYTNTP